MLYSVWSLSLEKLQRNGHSVFTKSNFENSYEKCPPVWYQNIYTIYFEMIRINILNVFENVNSFWFLLLRLKIDRILIQCRSYVVCQQYRKTVIDNFPSGADLVRPRLFVYFLLIDYLHVGNFVYEKTTVASSEDYSKLFWSFRRNVFIDPPEKKGGNLD